MAATLAAIFRGALALAVASAIWLPLVHLLFRPAADLPGNAIPDRARQMLNHQERVVRSPVAARAVMRDVNPEWDLMGRTFLVLSLANSAQREPARAAAALAEIDVLIQETLADEAAGGPYVFLLPYGRRAPFVDGLPRSQFVDSEIALMIAVRRWVEDSPALRAEGARRCAIMAERMDRSPVLSAESYPDECWTFCNTMALASIRLMDLLDGTDHDVLLKRWVASARVRLIDPSSGLLVSSFTHGGEPRDPPEGSSIWMSAHLLQLVDPEFAADQYARARKLLGAELFGFAFAREWPAGSPRRTDVDSGPVLPGIDLSTSSSGLACVAAAAFDDRAFRRGILTTLEFGGFPVRDHDGVYFAASNQVGDAVVLYAWTMGPIWREARERMGK